MMDTPNVVSCRVEDQTLIVSVTAKQLRDIVIVNALRDGVLQAIEQSKVKNVIMDLSKVEQIGSVAFLAFLSIRRQSGIDRIILTNLCDFVQELFAMCKLIATGNGKSAPFLQADNVEAALAQCDA